MAHGLCLTAEILGHTFQKKLDLGCVIQFGMAVPAHIKFKVLGKVEPLSLSQYGSWSFAMFQRE